jgi:hypothetical protein
VELVLVRGESPIRIITLLIAGGCVFLVGIGWGLPSSAANASLFPAGRTWSGRRILRLAGDFESVSHRASDVSSTPLNREQAVVVNGTDQARARIVRRYRLMSHQPDEFTTFAALSGMRPGRGDLDPRMYKYGGLWVYPVGTLLKAAAVIGLVRLTPDPAYYLDHPEAFGRFYVVARLYSAMWATLAIVAVFLLVRKICGSTSAATWAALCFMLMPVVVTAAHEAKPHLAGVTLTLWAVLAGAAYIERPSRASAFIAAVLCGAAIGMVPLALPVLLVLPAMLLFHRLWHKELGPGGEIAGLKILANVAGLMAISGVVFCITNPYVPMNLFRDRAVLRSNFGNSSDFYHAGASGLSRAVGLVGLGMSFVLAGAGAVGAIALAVRAARKPLNVPDETRRRATGILLATATLPTAFVFFVFASGQPADYARFALPFDVFLAIEAVVAIETFVAPGWRNVCFAFLALTTGFFGVQYLVGFQRDCGPKTSRAILADELASRLSQGDGVLASREEPAPWSLPPVDLFRWTIVLPPRNWPADRPFEGADATIGPDDFFLHPTLGQVLFSTPISWADKSFKVQVSSNKGAAR